MLEATKKEIISKIRRQEMDSLQLPSVPARELSRLIQHG